MAEAKKGRKFGRHKDRSPSMKRYRNENRMDRNKRLAIEKDAKMKAEHADKKASKKHAGGVLDKREVGM